MIVVLVSFSLLCVPYIMHVVFISTVCSKYFRTDISIFLLVPLLIFNIFFFMGGGGVIFLFSGNSI